MSSELFEKVELDGIGTGSGPENLANHHGLKVLSKNCDTFFKANPKCLWIFPVISSLRLKGILKDLRRSKPLENFRMLRRLRRCWRPETLRPVRPVRRFNLRSDLTIAAAALLSGAGAARCDEAEISRLLRKAVEHSRRGMIAEIETGRAVLEQVNEAWQMEKSYS